MLIATGSKAMSKPAETGNKFENNSSFHLQSLDKKKITNIKRKMKIKTVPSKLVRLKNNKKITMKHNVERTGPNKEQKICIFEKDKITTSAKDISLSNKPQILHISSPIENEKTLMSRNINLMNQCYSPLENSDLHNSEIKQYLGSLVEELLSSAVLQARDRNSATQKLDPLIKKLNDTCKSRHFPVILRPIESLIENKEKLPPNSDLENISTGKRRRSSDRISHKVERLLDSEPLLSTTKHKVRKLLKNKLKKVNQIMKIKIKRNKKDQTIAPDPIVIYEDLGNETVQLELFENRSDVCVIEETRPHSDVKSYFKISKDKNDKGYRFKYTTESDPVVKKLKPLKYKRIRPCEICNKNFDGANSLVKRVSHLCTHFKEELLSKLVKTNPYCCPVANCNFETKTERVWMMHYGWIHKMVFKCMEKQILTSTLENEIKQEHGNKQHDQNNDILEEEHEVEKRTDLSSKCKLDYNKPLGSSPCEVCGRHFLGAHADSLKIDHLCIHFRSELLEDLRDTNPPYKCPVPNCTFESNTITIWMYHYASVHNMINKCLRFYLDNLGNEIISRFQQHITDFNLLQHEKNQSKDINLQCKVCAINLNTVKQENNTTKMEHLFGHILEDTKRKIKYEAGNYKCSYASCKFVTSSKSLIAFHLIIGHDVNSLLKKAFLRACKIQNSCNDYRLSKYSSCKSKETSYFGDRSKSSTTLSSEIHDSNGFQEDLNIGDISNNDYSKSELSSRDIVCNMCNHRFNSKKARTYAIHMSKHFKNRLREDLKQSYPPFKCPMAECGYETHKIDKWTTHYGLVHDKINELVKDKELKEIAKATTLFSQTHDSNGVREDLKIGDLSQVDISNSKISSRDIVCKMCNHRFKSKNPKAYAIHMSKHFKNRLQEDLKQSSPPFRCPIEECGYETHKIDKWTTHYGLVHDKINELVKDKELKDIAKAIVISSEKWNQQGRAATIPTKFGNGHIDKKLTIGKELSSKKSEMQENSVDRETSKEENCNKNKKFKPPSMQQNEKRSCNSFRDPFIQFPKKKLEF